MNRQTVSVVIPTLNRVEALLNLLEDISNQTELPDEVIIVEGGTLNWNYKKIPNNLFLYVPNGGASISRNEGLKKSQSNIIIFFDDDIRIEKNYIEIAKKYLYDNPEIMALGGQYIDDNTENKSTFKIQIGRILKIYGQGKSNNILKSGWGDYVRGESVKNITEAEWLFGCNIVIRSKCIKKIKDAFEPQMLKWSFLDDLLLGIRITKMYGICMRIHPNLIVKHNQLNLSAGDISTETLRMRILYRYIIWRDYLSCKGENYKLDFFLGMLGNIIITYMQNPRIYVLKENINTLIYVINNKYLRWTDANEYIFKKN
jgi:glycosyltransferase involved in cell wall biosynthesis